MFKKSICGIISRQLSPVTQSFLPSQNHFTHHITSLPITQSFLSTRQTKKKNACNGYSSYTSSKIYQNGNGTFHRIRFSLTRVKTSRLQRPYPDRNYYFQVIVSTPPPTQCHSSFRNLSEQSLKILTLRSLVSGRDIDPMYGPHTGPSLQKSE